MGAPTNIPRAKDKSVELKVEVAGNDIVIWAVNKHGDDRGVKVTTVYVGDHMLTADNHQQFMEMIGREISVAIQWGRDAGYRHAQHDMQAALGLLG
jgi:hypothetical protein